MVRSFPAPSPLAGVDGKRIAGNVGVVALHLLVLAILLMPSTWEAPEPAPRPAPPVVTEYVPPEPIIETTPPPQPILVRPQPQPQPTPTPVVITESPPVSDAPVFEDGEIHVPVQGDAGPPVTSYDPGPPAAVELALDVHPSPRYPRTSLRRGEQGTVVLRVRVDERGAPVEVTIEHSSGYRDLDRAARDTVADRWRFHPAQRDGRPVPAWGLVPVRFTLP